VHGRRTGARRSLIVKKPRVGARGAGPFGIVEGFPYPRRRDLPTVQGPVRGIR